MTRESSPKVAFITARLDEEERLALDVEPQPDLIPADPIEFILAAGDLTTPGIAAAEDHITRQGPRLTLRKIEAMRKLLAAHLDYYGADDDEGYPIETLTILAAIWDDHEDYPALVGTVMS